MSTADKKSLAERLAESAQRSRERQGQLKLERQAATLARREESAQAKLDRQAKQQAAKVKREQKYQTERVQIADQRQADKVERDRKQHAERAQRQADKEHTAAEFQAVKDQRAADRQALKDQWAVTRQERHAEQERTAEERQALQRDLPVAEFERVVLWDDRIELCKSWRPKDRGFPPDVRPLTGIQASVKDDRTGEEFLGLKTREVFLTISGPGFEWVVRTDNLYSSRKARDFAAKINSASQPAAASPAPTVDDVASQLAKLAGLYQAGVLSEDEFTAAKRRILDA